jgi:hypothetical protein
MSSRFHNKYHRHNHHTTPVYDPRYPDAAHDPIASADSPFIGPFSLIGTLSATGQQVINQLPSAPAAVFNGYPTSVIVNAISGTNTGVAIQATGDIVVYGRILSSNSEGGNSVSLTNNTQTFTTPVSTTGEFLLLTVNGEQRAIRLWN